MKIVTQELGDTGGLAPWAGGNRDAWVQSRIRQFAGGPPTPNMNGATDRFSNAWQSAFSLQTIPLPGPDEITAPYKENAWVRIATDAIVSRLVQLPFAIFDRDPGDRDAVQIEGHPIYDLLRKPTARMTWRQLVQQHFVNYKLDGESFWFLFNEQGQPCAVNERTEQLLEPPAMIIPVRGRHVDHVEDDNGNALYWRYRIETQGRTGKTGEYSEPFHRAAVVDFIDYDPSNSIRGFGALEAALWEVDLYYQGQRYIAASLQNGGNPGGWITFEESVMPHELQRRQRELDQSYGVDETGRWHLIDKRAKVTPNPVGPKDLEYGELLKFQRDLILALYQVPPQLAGVLEQSTMNNMDTAERLLWQGAVWDAALLMAEGLSERLLRPAQRLSGWTIPQQAVATFNSRGIRFLQTEESDRIEQAIKIAQAGIGVSFNDALATVGAQVPKIEGKAADEPWVAGSLETYDNATAKPEPMPAPGAVGDPGAAQAGQKAKKDEKPASKPKAEAKNAAEPGHICLEASEDPGVIDNGDAKIRRATEVYLGRYERAMLRHLKDITKGDSLTGLDEPAPEQFTVQDVLASGAVLNVTEWAERYLSTTGPAMRRVFRDALRLAFTESRGEFIGLDHASVLRWLSGVPPRIAEGYSTNLANQMAKLITRTLNSDANPIDSVATLRQHLQAVLPELEGNLKRAFQNKEARALTVARTETGRIQNGARWLQYRHAGVQEIEWITQGDDNVRSTHRALAGTRRTMGDSFPNGLRYPHDPQGQASEVINCRCRFKATKFQDDE